MADEVELKLDLSSSAAAAIEASGLLPGEAGRVRQSSIYFDTPDQALARAGVSLRIRKSDGKRVQTIKAAGASAAGLFARSEWERAVRNDTPVLDAKTPLPPSLGECADAIAPIFEVAIDRHSWIVAEGDATIEVVLDRGKVVAGDRQSPICEIELELKSGAPAALFAFARKLDAVAPVRLGVLTKAERGYRLAGPAPTMVKAEPVLLVDGVTPARAFAIVAQSCIRQFRLNESLLLAGGGAAALHQARVALRRLRSAFSIFRPVVGDPGAALGADLRWLASELGEARNLDVLLARTRPAGSLRDSIAAARASAYHRVGEVLEMPRTRHMMLDLAEWIGRADRPDRGMRMYRREPLQLPRSTGVPAARRSADATLPTSTTPTGTRRARRPRSCAMPPNFSLACSSASASVAATRGSSPRYRHCRTSSARSTIWQPPPLSSKG